MFKCDRSENLDVYLNLKLCSRLHKRKGDMAGIVQNEMQEYNHPRRNSPNDVSTVGTYGQFSCGARKVRKGQSSIKASTRGVYQLLQIQIYVIVLQNGRVPLTPIGIKVSLLLQEVCIDCLKSKYMLVFKKKCIGDILVHELSSKAYSLLQEVFIN